MIEKNRKRKASVPATATGKKVYAQYGGNFSFVADNDHNEPLWMALTASITENKERPIYRLTSKGHGNAGYVQLSVTGSIANYYEKLQYKTSTDFCINIRLATYVPWYFHKSLRDLLEPSQIVEIQQSLYETCLAIAQDVSDRIVQKTDHLPYSKIFGAVDKTLSVGYSDHYENFRLHSEA